MSHDSRRIHSMLHALREHLEAHNAAVAAAAEAADRQLAERQSGPIPDTHKQPSFTLPERSSAPVDH